MPIYNQRDLIPFVNKLEASINDMKDSVTQWDINKFKLISAAGKVDSTYSSAIGALVRADEAMAEIGTAVFKSTANRGKRLEDTFTKLKNEIYDVIQAGGIGSSGGGGSLTSGVFYDELNNAISSVDATITDGLKLDYRLREIQEVARIGEGLSAKDLHMPYKYEVATPSTASFAVTVPTGVVLVDAEVTVLDAAGNPFFDNMHKMIRGDIDKTGNVLLTAIPPSAFTIYFPVKMKLKDMPEDFLYLFMQQIVQKNSRAMEIILGFEDQIVQVLEDINYMKGVSWTPDFSIMKNHQDMIKEGITPKGLNIEVKNGMANVMFNYNDHPHLSHFVLEKWDEPNQQFIPYDGASGIVNK